MEKTRTANAVRPAAGRPGGSSCLRKVPKNASSGIWRLSKMKMGVLATASSLIFGSRAHPPQPLSQQARSCWRLGRRLVMGSCRD